MPQIPDKSNSASFLTAQISEEIRSTITTYCAQNHLKLYAFARNAEISYSTLRDFMFGKTEPKLGTLVRIAVFMDMTLAELVTVQRWEAD